MEDKREFRRYKCESACEIRIGNDLYQGCIVDYSDGLGVIAEKSPFIKKGALADIRILDSGTEMKGEVAWVREIGKDIRVGFKRVGNLTGNLKDFKLADLLVGIQRGTRTGTLQVVSGSIVKRIYIKNGDMIYSDSNFKEDGLAETLLRKGRITTEQYNQASERMLATKAKLGKILVSMSCITPKELFIAAQHQIEEIILTLFAFEEGEFEFKEGPLPSDTLITLRISAANIIYRGIKKIQNHAHIKQMSPSPEAVLKVSRNPMGIFQSLSLDVADEQILFSINGIDPLRKILSLSPLSDLETLKAVCSFLKIGLIAIKEENEAPAMISTHAELTRQLNEIPEDFLEKIEELYSQSDSAVYYDFLGIDKQASREEIQKAYYGISRQFHPDRHFILPSHDIKGKLIKICTYATEASTILSDPERRERYDKALLLKVLNLPDTKEKDHPPEENQASPETSQLPDTGDITTGYVISDFQEGNERGSEEDTETHYELGVSYLEMGLLEDAITEFKIASNDPSKKLECGRGIAGCYMEKGDYGQAIEEFKRILSELSSDDKEYLDLKYELADSYLKNYEYYNAAELYQEIHSDDAGYKDVAKKIAYLNDVLSE